MPGEHRSRITLAPGGNVRMGHHVDRADVRVALENVQCQVFDGLDLLGRIGRKGKLPLVIGRQVDNLHADRGVVQVAAITPTAHTCMPGPLGFVHQVENLRFPETCFQIGGVAKVGNQVMGADRRACQCIDGRREVAGGVMENQKTNATVKTFF
ncbi:hypothetical protein D3C76_1140280 [compost metagenome]